MLLYVTEGYTLLVCQKSAGSFYVNIVAVGDIVFEDDDDDDDNNDSNNDIDDMMSNHITNGGS